MHTFLETTTKNISLAVKKSKLIATTNIHSVYRIYERQEHLAPPESAIDKNTNKMQIKRIFCY